MTADRNTSDFLGRKVRFKNTIAIGATQVGQDVPDLVGQVVGFQYSFGKELAVVKVGSGAGFVLEPLENLEVTGSDLSNRLID